MSAEPRRSRIGGVVNLTGAVLVLALVLTVALRATQSSPPALAEFAPQAQQIKPAPQEQTAIVGSAPGGAAVGAAPSPSPSPPAGLPDGAITNHCVGDPPRQIEDPQSPPCVAYWVGNNGGHTSKGVDGDKITLVLNPSSNLVPQSVVDFFNSRFELYGRKIVMAQPGRSDTTGSNTDAASQRAEADNEDQQYHPFIALNSNAGGGIDYADELARDHIIATFVRSYMTEGWLSAHAPYAWSYPMAQDTLQRTFAAWACARLKGGNATHAGPGSKNLPRKYGFVFTTEAIDIPISTQPFQDGLAGCGIQLAYVATPTTGSTAGQDAQTSFETAVVNMKNDGVTSVFFLGDRVDMAFMMQYAEKQAYFPEWLDTDYSIMPDNANIRDFGSPLDERANLFGITVEPMLRQFQDHPSTWAQQGAVFTSDANTYGSDYNYWNLLLIASGIQMAGPNLTPGSFQSGLWRTVFPNPPSPLAEGKVGFNGGTHSMTIDAAERWWSNTASGPYADESGGGAWCFVGHGARHSLADPWPRGDPFFQAPCDSGDEPASP